jgi:hypothetical protein
MKNFVRSLFTEKFIVAGFLGAIVGLTIGGMLSGILGVGLYRGGVPLEVAALAVVGPTLLGAAGAYSLAYLKHWVFSDASKTSAASSEHHAVPSDR